MRTLAISMLLLAAALPLAAQDNGKQEEGVSLTVYNGGYGLVREVRTFEIGDKGVALFKDVAQQIDPTTVHFRSLTDPKAKLLEQNYQFDLVSADKLLAKYIDEEIEVIAGGKGENAEVQKYAGTLLSFDGSQLVIKDKQGGIIMVARPDNVRDIRFKMLPEGLLTKPTLVWLVSTSKPGKQLAEVTYQTGGLGWHAEYVMVLDGDDATADFNGWVSVDNRSGKGYKNARMKFIAGDVRRITPERDYRASGKGGGYAEAADAAPMAEKAFFEYHMYTLPRRSTVASNEVKQLEMFSPVKAMGVKKKFLYYPSQGYRWYGGYQAESSYGTSSPKKVQVYIEVANTKDNKLGLPLPAGKVRVFKNDPDDKAMEFVGEEQIDHTPNGAKLELQIGNAFDIQGEKKQTAFSVDTSRREMTESFEVKIYNSKKEDIVVRFKDNFFRAMTSKVTANSKEKVFEQLDAFTGAWDLPVPKMEGDKRGEVTLKYTVEYRW